MPSAKKLRQQRPKPKQHTKKTISNDEFEALINAGKTTHNYQFDDPVVLELYGHNHDKPIEINISSLPPCLLMNKFEFEVKDDA